MDDCDKTNRKLYIPPPEVSTPVSPHGHHIVPGEPEHIYVLAEEREIPVSE